MPEATASTLNNIPEFLLWFAFIGGLTVTTFQVLKFIIQFLIPAKLDIRLTKELFFRVSDWGECLFPNIVLISRRKTSEIKSISFELKKISNKQSTSELKFKVKPKYFGEKRRSEGNPFAENYFHTQSSMFFIPKDAPTRMVIFAMIDKSDEEFSKVTTDFNIAVDDLKNEYYDQAVSLTEDLIPELQKKTNLITKEFGAKILDLVQLKSGDYKLSATIRYKTLHFISYQRKSESKISFSVEDNIRNNYRIKIESLLRNSIIDILSNKVGVITFPEYYPIKVKEL